MKRDMDLIRLLLLDKEGEDLVNLSKYTDEQIKYHLALLIEAELMEGNVQYSSRMHSEIPAKIWVSRITWNGHEFLDKARNEKVWNKAKEIIKDAGASLSMQAIIKALEKAVDYIMS